MARRWRWGREAGTQDSLERAERSLEEAREQRAEQERKRVQEQEGVIARMERLAEENHLAGWVMEIISGNGGQR